MEEAQVEIIASNAIFVYIKARGLETGCYNFQQPIRQKSPLFYFLQSDWLVPSMRLQVIQDSLFSRLGSRPIFRAG